LKDRVFHKGKGKPVVTFFIYGPDDQLLKEFTSSPMWKYWPVRVKNSVRARVFQLRRWLRSLRGQ
jgi:hypothetical protein